MAAKLGKLAIFGSSVWISKKLNCSWISLHFWNQGVSPWGEPCIPYHTRSSMLFCGPFQKEIQHPLQPAELASSPFGPREWWIFCFKKHFQQLCRVLNFSSGPFQKEIQLPLQPAEFSTLVHFQHPPAQEWEKLFSQTFLTLWPKLFCKQPCDWLINRGWGKFSTLWHIQHPTEPAEVQHPLGVLNSAPYRACWKCFLKQKIHHSLGPKGDEANSAGCRGCWIFFWNGPLVL